MFLAYLDESYSQDWYFMAAMLCEGSGAKAIGEHCQGIILRGMHSGGQRARYSTPEPPHSVVLMHLLERINMYAQRHETYVLVIADEVGEQSRHRSDFAAYRHDGTWGYRAMKLTRILDTIHFAPSGSSRLVQAIDLIVFMYRRMETHVEPIKAATRANERLWARIESKVTHRGCWFPQRTS